MRGECMEKVKFCSKHYCHTKLIKLIKYIWDAESIKEAADIGLFFLSEEFGLQEVGIYHYHDGYRLVQCSSKLKYYFDHILERDFCVESLFPNYIQLKYKGKKVGLVVFCGPYDLDPEKKTLLKGFIEVLEQSFYQHMKSSGRTVKLLQMARASELKKTKGNESKA